MATATAIHQVRSSASYEKNVEDAWDGNLCGGEAGRLYAWSIEAGLRWRDEAMCLVPRYGVW